MRRTSSGSIWLGAADVVMTPPEAGGAAVALLTGEPALAGGSGTGAADADALAPAATARALGDSGTSSGDSGGAFGAATRTYTRPPTITPPRAKPEPNSALAPALTA